MSTETVTTDWPLVDVVVCVHNSLEDVQRCISSVIESDYPADHLNLIIVDDGSGEETASYLRDWVKDKDNAQLIRREQAGGYTIAANTGLKQATGEIAAMLNSDTIVPKRWLQKITRIFADKPDVGLVGPLSNAASWQSVPELSAKGGGWAINPLKEGFSVTDMDEMIAPLAEDVGVLPRVPLLNGFCFVIRRAICEDIGYFDEEGFPRGYGEEDDFCIRATDAGYGLVLAINTYVFHAKSKSYGTKTRNELSQQGQIVLRQKHSKERLDRAVKTMRLNPYLAQIRDAVGKAMTA